MMYFTRILRFTDLEVWDITMNDMMYRMFISDENRPSTENDLNVVGTVEREDLRSNLVKVCIYSLSPVKEEHIEILDQFAKQLTDHIALAHCDVVLNFFTQSIDEAFQQIVQEKSNIDVAEIPLERLWHLNQNCF